MICGTHRANSNCTENFYLSLQKGVIFLFSVWRINFAKFAKLCRVTVCPKKNLEIMKITAFINGTIKHCVSNQQILHASLLGFHPWPMQGLFSKVKHHRSPFSQSSVPDSVPIGISWVLGRMKSLWNYNWAHQLLLFFYQEKTVKVKSELEDMSVFWERCNYNAVASIITKSAG